MLKARFTSKRWVFIATLIVAFVVATPFAVDYAYNRRAQNLASSLQGVGKDALRSHGGVDAGNGVDLSCPHFSDWIGALFDDRGPCPTAGSSWLVPIKDGQGKDFIASVLRDAGYSYNPELISLRSGGGTKGGVSLDIELTDASSVNLPYVLPAGEIWTRVNLQASY